MRERSALVACVVLGLACVQTSPPEGAGARGSELIVRTLLTGWETADSAGIADLFWPRATYDDFAGQVTHQGIEEIIAYVTSAHRWGDDVYMNVGRVQAADAFAVAEWVFSAVHSRPMGDAVPQATGREVVLNGVTIVELEGSRIIRAADYVDTAPLWLQLGGRIELPGGGVLELDGLGN